jgi:hypothetical protein
MPETDLSFLEILLHEREALCSKRSGGAEWLGVPSSKSATVAHVPSAPPLPLGTASPAEAVAGF